MTLEQISCTAFYSLSVKKTFHITKINQEAFRAPPSLHNTQISNAKQIYGKEFELLCSLRLSYEFKAHILHNTV